MTSLRPKYILVWTLLNLIFGGFCLGQDCTLLMGEADALERKRIQVEKDNKKLNNQVSSQNDQLKKLGIPQPPLSPKQKIDPQQERYQDDAGNCLVGTKDWGRIKDLREFKLDSIKNENQDLIDRIDYLNQIIHEASNNTPRPENKNQDKHLITSTTKETRTLSAARSTFLGKTYIHCRIDPLTATLRATTYNRNQSVHGFDIILKKARARDKNIVMAMNAGIFHPNKSPVGLLVNNGKEFAPLNTRKGRGNFFMQPNGVFFLTKNKKAYIVPTPSFYERHFPTEKLSVATQSGPMMVIKGEINSLFTPNSSNVHFRNAVGVRKDGSVIFAISEQQVNFYEFSQFFLELGCENVLYLDGTICRMYLPSINGKKDLYNSGHLGPILFVVE